MQVPIGCTMCVGDREHLLDLFFDCSFAQQCWSRVVIEFDMMAVESAPEWLLNRLSSDTEEKLIKISAVLWGVWFAKNKHIFENKNLSPAFTVDWSMKQIKEWRLVNKKRVYSPSPLGGIVQCQKCIWERPSAGTVKMNVNAAVKEGQHQFSVGLALRDSFGQYIIGKTRKFTGMISVVEVETMAILKGLSWMEELQLCSVVIESDSVLSVNAINKSYHNFLELDSVLQQCKNILRREVIFL